MNGVGHLNIGRIRISPNLVLAPMAGVTDSSFRRLIKELGGVGLIVTEFISVEGITRGNMRTHRMMKFLPEERPLSIQIFGYDEERIAATGKDLAAGAARGLDPAHDEDSNRVGRFFNQCRRSRAAHRRLRSEYGRYTRPDSDAGLQRQGELGRD